MVVNTFYHFSLILSPVQLARQVCTLLQFVAAQGIMAPPEGLQLENIACQINGFRPREELGGSVHARKGWIDSSRD